MAPVANLPPGTSTVAVRAVNTTTDIVVDAQAFVHPVQSGHERLNLPGVAFLLEHPTLHRRILFDCGSRKDFWKFSPRVKARLLVAIPGLRVTQGMDEILTGQGDRAGESGEHRVEPLALGPLWGCEPVSGEG